MYKHLLRQISEEIDWMALAPLILFIVLFVGVVYVAFSERKVHLDYMANMPLENDVESPESQS